MLLVLSLVFISAFGGKVAICHIPPGNPGNAHVITVSVNALEAHLQHGDYVMQPGMSCPAEEPDIVPFDFVIWVPFMPIVGCDAQGIGNSC